MKKLFKILFSLFFSIILLFAFALPLNPVGNWYQQFMPNLNGRTISDIFFVDSLTGWAVTPYLAVNDTSFVLKTSNGGDDWFIQHTRTAQFVGSNRIYFLNANTGFTAGVSNLPAYSAILKTTDGGNTWLNVNPPTSPFTARDISILNSDTIWVVSDNSLTGGVFFTSNGGANWQQQYSAGTQNPEKIYMVNARIGFISDQSGSSSIRKTTNSGVNWNLNVNGQWYFDIKFADSLTGWYSAASNIYKTTNCGDSWVLQNVPSGPDLLNLGINKLSILNYDTLWAAGNAVFFPNSQVRAILLRTTNGGSNWQYQVPDTAINNFLYYHLQFINRNNGWAYTGVRGIHTTTGGDPVWITAIEQISSEIPKEYKLHQNYPNPFNPKTNIKYQITNNNTNVKLIVFDIQGKQIAELVNQKQSAGTYEVDFSGNSYSSGVYFYSLISDGNIISTKRMVLVK